MEKFKLTYNKIHSKNGLLSRDLYFSFLKYEYEESRGWGFSAISIDNTLISGFLLLKQKRYYQIWDAENNKLEKVPYFIVKEISFFLDIEKSYIIIQGGISDMNGLKTVLRQLLWGEFVYEEISLNTFDFITELENNNALVNIEEVSFLDFCLNDQFVGKYIAKPVNIITTLETLRSVQGDMDKIKVHVNISNIDFKILVSSNNTFILYGTEECLSAFIHYLISK